jgi:hypothetical protein
MPAKNYKLVKKGNINSEEVIKKATNIKELLNLEFPAITDELRKINHILDLLNTKCSEFEARLLKLEKHMEK